MVDQYVSNYLGNSIYSQEGNHVCIYYQYRKGCRLIWLHVREYTIYIAARDVV